MIMYTPVISSAAFPIRIKRFATWSIGYKLRSTLLLVAVVISTAAVAGSPEFSASPGAGNQSFATKCPTYYATNSCGSCHTSAPALQVYGAAYKTAVLVLGGRTAANAGQALTNIESADSDGDGYRNIIEINNNKQAFSAADHPTAAVALSTGQNAKSGTAGTTASYTATVTNNGNLTDSFTLGVSVAAGQSWTPTIVGTANNLAAGGTANITVNVSIAGSAVAAQTSTATVTAASQANTGISATVLPLTTTATGAPVTAIRYVNVATGSDTSNTCAVQGSPCKTITYAMSQAVAGNPGDLISVAPGTYNLTTGEVFPITFKSGVQLVATGTPANTIIDAVGDTVKQAVIKSTSNVSAFARIEGFTIRNGRGTAPDVNGAALGGGVALNSSSALFTITRNILVAIR